MTISSRTPEGLPHHCPVCGKLSAVEPSYPGDDSCCPSCGQLLWWFKDHLGRDVTFSTSFAETFGADSLELVEMVMALEEEFSVTIPDNIAEQIKTVAEAIRYIEKHRTK